MKVVYLNNITVATADEEDANFLVGSALDDIIRHVWRATSVDATVTLTVSAYSNVVAIYGTNAETITVTIKDITEVTTIDGPTVYNLKSTDTKFELRNDYTGSDCVMWAEYPYQDVQHKVILEFDTNVADLYVEAGIIRAGLGFAYGNPEYGLTESFRDYSITQELNSGGLYVNQKSIVRTINISMILERFGEWPTFNTWFRKEIGASPIPWLVVSDVSNQIYTLFARVTSFPVGTYNSQNYISVSFELLEMT